MIKTKYKIILAFCKSLLLVSVIFLLQSFLIKTSYNTNLFNTIIVKVQQESNNISISVTTSENNKVEFFMFNVEGKLIKELNINGTKKINIPELQKGMYTYDFFSKDERIKSGKIELK